MAFTSPPMLLSSQRPVNRSLTPEQREKQTPQMDEKQQKYKEQLWSSPEWHILCTWQHLPGSGVLLEMMLRDRGCDKRHDADVHAIGICMSNLSIQLQYSSRSAFYQGHISMAASVHKLMLLCTTAPHLVAQDQLTPQSYASTSNVNMRKLLHPAHIALRNCLEDVLTHTSTFHEQGCTSSKATMVDNTMLGCDWCIDSCVSDLDDINLCHVVPEELRQLRAVLVLVLVQVSNLWKGLMQQGYASIDHASHPDFCWEKRLEVHDVELAALASKLSVPLHPPGEDDRLCEFKEVAAIWDEYALGHFSGRLLTGCSYLHCTNMSGASESALKTLLCGGCRRMRYCSVSCQRGAWVLGGHSRVCGRAGWALGHC